MNLVKLTGFESIYAIDDFQKEYAKLFGKSIAQRKEYYKKLLVNLGILDKLKLDALEMQQFEPLSNEDGVYSIRHVSKVNPRVIFTMVTSDGLIILLTCAKEKSTSDYTRAIKKARQFRNEILQSLQEGDNR